MATWGSLAPDQSGATGSWGNPREEANRALWPEFRQALARGLDVGQPLWMRMGSTIAKPVVTGAVEGAVRGATLPYDVLSGQVDPNSDEAIRRSMDLAMMAGGAAMPLSMAVPEGSGSLGIFAGRAAANRLAAKGVSGPKAALDLAETMGAAGASREGIYAATNKLLEGTQYAGATRGVDGKLRFEIDDSGLNLREGATGTGTIGGHYSHPELFSAYPSVKNEWSTVSVNPSAAPGGTGSYSAPFSLMTVSAPTAEEATSSAAHELQHAAQSREGFSSGANASGGLLGFVTPFSAAARKVAWDRYYKNPGEVEARNVENRLTLSPEQRRATPPWSTADVPPEEQIAPRRLWGSLSAPR